MIRKTISIESRGRQGILSYITKLGIRAFAKVGYFKNKKEEYLEK